jgi:hypothetical protein
MASARSTTTVAESRKSRLMMPVTEGLRSMPERTKPLTFGRPARFARRPPR